MNKLVTRNSNSLSCILGISSSIIGFISLIFCCVGVGLPSWYQGLNSDKTILLAQANLFSSCFLFNSISYTCTSYNSYSCSTTSYQNTVLNQTSYLSGCLNPINGSSIYLTNDAPIYQIYLDDFYRLRSSAILSIISILFILFSLIFALLIGLIHLNIVLVFFGAIFALLAVIFGVCCLAVAGTVLKSTGVGFALFVVGIILELFVLTVLSITSGYLYQLKKNIQEQEDDDQSKFTRPISSPIYIRRVLKRRI